MKHSAESKHPVSKLYHHHHIGSEQPRGANSKVEYSLRREESHFEKKVKTSRGVCLSIISTFTETCEISSATAFSECHPIPNQMTDVGCHRKDRSGTATNSRLPAGPPCLWDDRTLQPSETALPAPVQMKDGGFAPVYAPSRVWDGQSCEHFLSSGLWVRLL